MFGRLGSFMRKRETLYFGITIFILTVGTILYYAWAFRYPLNERHSRRECRSHLLDIGVRLHTFVELDNDGNMPTDLYELAPASNALICPGQSRSLVEEILLKEPCGVYVTSYRLLTPGMIFADISDGTVVIQELPGNHPECLVGKQLYPAGYHVLMKDRDHFRVEFIASSSAPRAQSSE
jgi:hypothetical protein